MSKHSPESIHSKIVRIFADTLGVLPETITPSVAYHSHEKWDSFKHLELVSNLERAFGINIPMDAMIEMDTVKRTEEVVLRCLSSL